MQKKGKCYVVGAGEWYGHQIEVTEDDYVIGVDGGVRYLEENGIAPDLMIGDFDSLGYVPKTGNIIRLQVEKDDTDMMAALQEGIRRGYREFHIYGACGGRVSHTVANVQTLVWLAEQEITGYVYGDRMIMCALKDSGITFDADCSGYISVFSHTDKSIGVNESGLKYELNDAVLTNDTPLGISNEFIGVPAKISVEDGVLILIKEWS